MGKVNINNRSGHIGISPDRDSRVSSNLTPMIECVGSTGRNVNYTDRVALRLRFALGVIEDFFVLYSSARSIESA
jgi:hypothetical protein